MGKKIAVLFPGIGYTCDKPLLYYSAKIAGRLGFDVVRLPYGGFPSGVKGDPAKMYQCFVSAREQAEEMLRDVKWDDYETIVFFSKSVGTAVARSYASEHQIAANHVLYTPVEKTFGFPGGPSIVFHGTADPWAATEVITKACERENLPLFVFRDADHSLETGKVRKDIKRLRRVMGEVEAFLEE